MTKEEELSIFLSRVDDFTDSKYILADVKIVALLKSVASLPTVLSVFKSCLSGYDYETSKKMHLLSDSIEENKGQFLPIYSSKENVAFTFNILMQIDAKKISLSEFIEKYFYGDGSVYSAFMNFINKLILPFRSAVVYFMTSIDSSDVSTKVSELDKIEHEKKDEEIREKEESEKLSQDKEKKRADDIAKIKELLLLSKKNVKEGKIDKKEQEDVLYIIDMFANVLNSFDKDSYRYAYLSYKYCAKTYKKYMGKTLKKVSALCERIINGL